MGKEILLWSWKTLMTFKPSLHHLGPFVGAHVFERKYGDAWPGPWSRHTKLKPPLHRKSRLVLTVTVCLLSIGPPGPWRPPSLEEAVQAASALMESRRAVLSTCFWFNVKTQGSKRPVAAAYIRPASHHNGSFLPMAVGC